MVRKFKSESSIWEIDEDREMFARFPLKEGPHYNEYRDDGITSYKHGYRVFTEYFVMDGILRLVRMPDGAITCFAAEIINN